MNVTIDINCAKLLYKKIRTYIQQYLLFFNMKKSPTEDPQSFKIALDPDTNQIPGGFFLNLLLSLGYQ